MLGDSSDSELTRDEAEEIIQRTRKDTERIIYSDHFLGQGEAFGYESYDWQDILRKHTISDGPVWDSDHQDHVVCLDGKSRDGRRTRVVVGITETECCVMITIIDLDKAK